MVPRRRVAASQAPHQATPLVPANIRHPRNCPALANGGSGSTWNHKTGNHRGGVGKDSPQHREPQGPFPSPSPPLRHTDDNDGDDVVHNDVDVLFPVSLLVVPFSYVALGFGRACSLLYLVENRAWLCDVLAETVSAVCHSKPSFGWVAFMYA